mmetsp:Transcript_7314/g.15995  ORF Transcript_7314/g.15995 Transcript_7314/m.15995 type:complete len:251 (+) Transcript_7314:81-833(+)
MEAHQGWIVVSPQAGTVLAEFEGLPCCSEAPSRRPRPLSLPASGRRRNSRGGPRSTGLGGSGQGRPTTASTDAGAGRRGKSRTATSLGGSDGATPSPQGEWQCATLFSGERVCTLPKAKRSSAAIFRRPQHSRFPAHQRPIFLSGCDGQDSKMCVDCTAPKRFSSFLRDRCQLTMTQCGARSPGSRSATPSGNYPDAEWLASARRSPTSEIGRSSPCPSIVSTSRPASVLGVTLRLGPSPTPSAALPAEL